MREFYEAYYAAVEASRAHHLFCERVFGRDLGQHGFADLKQLDLLQQAAQFGPGRRVLDVGCGNGLIAEYLSDASHAHVTGLDYVPGAIRQAQLRTAGKSERLAFVVGDLNRLGPVNDPFDVVVSIDTLYFSDNYAATLAVWKAALRPGGQLAILFPTGPGRTCPGTSSPKRPCRPTRPRWPRPCKPTKWPFEPGT